MNWLTRDKVKGHVQQSKDDWWDCNCGKQHKGYPYLCPIKSLARIRVLEEENDD